MLICEEYDTIQGEGKYLGAPSRFIRTTGCNLRCIWLESDGTKTKCDSPYTSWNPERGYNLNPEDTVRELKNSNIEHIVITGGEPTLQKDLKETQYYFIEEGYFVTIETNGTRYISEMNQSFISLSPKLNSSTPLSGKERKIHQNNNDFIDTTIKWIENNPYQIKFVINSPNDFNEVEGLIKKLKPDKRNVWLMSQGITKEQIREKQEWIIPFCMEKGYNYSPRMQIEIWGNVRKR